MIQLLTKNGLFKRLKLVTLTAAVFTASFQAPQVYAAEPEIVFKAVSAVRGDPSRVFLEAFKDALELYTNDRVRVDIFDAGTFGGQKESAKGVRKGIPDFALPASNNLSGLSPSYGGVLALPYLVSSQKQLLQLREAPIWDEMKAKLEEDAGLKLLGQSLVGMRWMINSKRPVESLKDLEGLKIRVPPVPQYIAAFESWGVPPTPIPWTETPAALQQGVIDGLDNPPGVLLAFKFYEQAKYITKLNFSMMSASFIMGKDNFEKQPDDIKAAIVQAAKDAEQWQLRTYNFRQEITLKALEGHGVTISEVTDEPEWQKRAQSAWPGLVDRSGGKEWVDKVKAAIADIK